MARKRYMEEAERVMLLMYSVYYNETGQIANSSNLKGAMTRGRNFAQSCAKNAIDDMVRQTIDDAVKQAEGRIKMSIERANLRIQEIIVNAMNKNFADQINAAIAAKLAEHFPVTANG